MEDTLEGYILEDAAKPVSGAPPRPIHERLAEQPEPYVVPSGPAPRPKPALTPTPEPTPEPKQAPWYNPLLVAGEATGNSFLGGFADEGASLLAGLAGDPGAEATGMPSEYAGSSLGDTLEQERNERRNADTLSKVAGVAGDIAGAAAQTALGGAALGTVAKAAPVLTKAVQAAPRAAKVAKGIGEGVAGLGQTALQAAGQSSGDLSQRVESAGQYLADNPIETLLAGGSPLAAQGLGAAVKPLAHMASESRVASVLNEAQRYRHALKEGSQDAIAALGDKMLEYKLVNRWLPTTARTVNKRTADLLGKSGKVLETTENAFDTAGAMVDMTNRRNELLNTAINAEQRLDPASAKALENMAMGTGQRIEDLTGGTMQMGIKDAIARRREYDDMINWDLGAYEDAPINEAIRRDMAMGLREDIKVTMDQLAQSNPAMAEKVEAWRGANEAFSTGKTIVDPALMATQKEYGRAGDIAKIGMAASAGGAIAGAPGLAAGIVATSRGRNADPRLVSALGGAQQFGSDVAKAGAAVGRAVPTAVAANVSNEDLKQELEQSKSRGWDWAQQLLGIK